MCSTNLTSLAIALGLSVAATGAAQALSVELTFGPGTVLLVDDNSAHDQNPDADKIEIAGSYGGYDLLARFDAVLGLTGAVLTSDVGLAAAISDPQDIFFQAWHTGFAFSPPGITPGVVIGLPAQTTIQGGASGLVQVITNVDRSNTGHESVLVYPDQVVAFETYGTSGPELFSDQLTRSFLHTAGGLFSLRTGLTFDLDGIGETSYAFVENAVIPLPAPVLLLGAGLGTLGLAGRLTKRRSA